MTAIMEGLMTLEYEQLVLTNRDENILESEFFFPRDYSHANHSL